MALFTILYNLFLHKFVSILIKGDIYLPSMKWYVSVVEELRHETPTIDLVKLKMDIDYEFRPGQWALLEFEENNPAMKRVLSIACSPTRRGYIEFATRISNSDFKQRFKNLKKGDKVRVSEAKGNFVFNEDDKSAVFLSGGIGITPLRSMIQYVCDKRLKNKIMLLYSNRTVEEIAFRTEFEELEKSNPNLRIINIVTDSGSAWKGLSKRIDANIIREYSDVKNDVYYVCGPQVMVDAMVNILNSLSVSKDRIKFENFSGYK